MGILSEFLAPGAQALTAFSGLEDARNQAIQTGQTGYDLASQLGQQVNQQTQFKPFTVSTRTGSTATTPTGSLTTALSPEQAAAQQQLFSQGTGMLTGLGNVDQRSQQLFNLLSDIRRPEIERQQLGLEERLFNQGRSGVNTAQYGGTPEQLAMAKAIQEQQAQDVYTARNQALSEQQQQFGIGAGLMGQSYMPEQQLLPWLQQGLTGADIANTAQRQGSQLQALLGQSGIESLLQGQNLGTQIDVAQTQALADLFGNMQNPTEGGLLSGLDSRVTDWLGGIFGGLV
jgi:hypothetical protein